MKTTVPRLQKILDIHEILWRRIILVTCWISLLLFEISSSVIQQKNRQEFDEYLAAARVTERNLRNHFRRDFCRSCLLNNVTEWDMEEKEKWGRRFKQLLDDIEQMRRYRKLKGEALDRTPWRTRFRGCYGPVLRQTTWWWWWWWWWQGRD